MKRWNASSLKAMLVDFKTSGVNFCHIPFLPLFPDLTPYIPICNIRCLSRGTFYGMFCRAIESSSAALTLDKRCQIFQKILHSVAMCIGSAASLKLTKLLWPHISCVGTESAKFVESDDHWSLSTTPASCTSEFHFHE